MNDFINKVYNQDCLVGLKNLPDACIDMAITSPPFWGLRKYAGVESRVWSDGWRGCLGEEPRVEQYIEHLSEIFDQVKRVLKPEGSFYLELGYCFHTKQMLLVPEMVALEMQKRSWILRSKIIWYRKNALPSSVKDRYIVDYSPIFFFVKNPTYYFQQQLEPFAASSKPTEVYTGQARKNYEAEGAQNPSDTKRRILARMQARGGRSKRSVWAINVQPNKLKHTASFPIALLRTPILASCPEGGTILDPFMGSFTTAVAARELGRFYVGFEASKEYWDIGMQRLKDI